MQYFEAIFREMERLLISELPEVISKLNEEKNDGLIITPFSNKTLQDKNLQTPYFTFAISHTEKTSKDILIENIVLKCEIEIHLNETEKDYQIKLWRYFTAINALLDLYTVSDVWQKAYVNEVNGKKLWVRITV